MRSGFTFTSFRDESSTDVIKISLDGRDEGGLSFGGVDQGGKPTLGSHVGELLNGWNLNDDDTLFLYIRCHGRVDDGIWYGVDPQGVSFSIEDLLKPVTMKAGTLILLVDACHSAHVVGNIQRKKLLANVGRYLVMCSSDGRHHNGNAKFSEDVLAYRRVFFTKERAELGPMPISGPFLPILLHYLSGPAEDFGDVAERVTKDLSVRGATQIKSGSLPPLHCVFPKWRRLGDQPKRPPAHKVQTTAKGPRRGTSRGARQPSSSPSQGSSTGGSPSGSSPSGLKQAPKTTKTSSSSPSQGSATGGSSSAKKKGGNIVESLFEEATAPDELSMTGLWEILYPNQRRMYKIKSCSKDRRRKSKKLVGHPSATRNWPTHKRRHGLSRLHRHHYSQKM